MDLDEHLRTCTLAFPCGRSLTQNMMRDRDGTFIWAHRVYHCVEPQAITHPASYVILLEPSTIMVGGQQAWLISRGGP